MSDQKEAEKNLAQADLIGRIILYVIPVGILYYLFQTMELWVLVSIVIGVALLYGMIAGLILWIYRKKAAQDVRYIRILPAADTPFKQEKIMQLVRTFGSMGRRGKDKWLKGNPWYRMRLVLPEDSSEIAIYMGIPQDKMSGTRDMLQNIYPHCEIHDIPHDQFPQPSPEGVGGHFLFRRGRRKGLPMSSLREKKESPLGDILACLRPGTMLDVQFSPDGWDKLDDRSEEIIKDLKTKKVRDLDPDEKAKRTSLAKRLTGREEVFRVRMSLWSDNKYAIPTTRSVAVSVETTLKHDGAVRFYRWRNPWHRHPLRDTNLIPLPIPTSRMIWTDDELANLLHLPSADHPIYEKPRTNAYNQRGYVPHLLENHRTLNRWEMTKGAYVGTQVHPIYQRKIKIDHEQLTKHFLLTGAPGMGKSSLIIDMLDDMLREWIQNPDHPGFTIIDPSRETIAVVENRLAYLEKTLGIEVPKHRIRHFEFTDQSDYFPALNILHVPEGVELQTAADAAADVILHTASNDNLTEAKRILKNSVQSLILDAEEHSILAIPEFLRNPSFRKTVLQRIKKKDNYLYREIKSWGDEPIINEAILNRIDPLLRNKTMRRIYGQKDWTLDIRSYMNKGYLVFVDVLGVHPEGIKLTVGNLINQYHQIAKSRPKGAKYHFMIVEEFHLVQIPIIAKIIAEDRKFNFGIGLITQMIDQITDKELLTALELIGTILTCAQTGSGASKIHKMTEKYFSPSFISRLSERHAAVYTRTKIDKESQITSCVVQNRPPSVYLPDGREANFRTEEKGIAERYGLSWAKQFMVDCEDVKAKDEIDKQLQAYLDYMDNVAEPGIQPSDDDSDDGDKPGEAPKVMF